MKKTWIHPTFQIVKRNILDPGWTGSHLSITCLHRRKPTSIFQNCNSLWQSPSNSLFKALQPRSSKSPSTANIPGHLGIALETSLWVMVSLDPISHQHRRERTSRPTSHLGNATTTCNLHYPSHNWPNQVYYQETSKIPDRKVVCRPRSWISLPKLPKIQPFLKATTPNHQKPVNSTMGKQVEDGNRQMVLSAQCPDNLWVLQPPLLSPALFGRLPGNCITRLFTIPYWKRTLTPTKRKGPMHT